MAALLCFYDLPSVKCIVAIITVSIWAQAHLLPFPGLRTFQAPLRQRIHLDQFNHSSFLLDPKIRSHSPGFFLGGSGSSWIGSWIGSGSGSGGCSIRDLCCAWASRS